MSDAAKNRQNRTKDSGPAMTLSNSSVITFVRQSPAASFCDSCVALEVKVSLEEARTMLAELARDRLIDRNEGQCSGCGRSVTVTHLIRST